MRCRYCDQLNIETLVQLAKIEFYGRCSPISAYYQHHASIRDLERSAEAGCDLCRLIVRAFDQSSSKLDWKWRDEGENLIKALKAFDGEWTIRLSLQSDDIFMGKKIDEVQSFDLLQITAGEDENLSNEDDWMPHLPTVHLLLTSASETPPQLENISIGRRPTDSDLNSDSNYAIAKSWINDCMANHASCSITSPSFLPTRVIDVGVIGGTANIKVFVPGTRIFARYVALSHCWGGHIDCVLEKKSLAQFQNALPWNRLAANFQDAIIITRKLGFRYLWIDSLCIIQDEDQDWAQQSTQMADIYRHSVTTISAISSPSSGHGILRRGEQQTPSHNQQVTVQLAQNDPTLLNASCLASGDILEEEDLQLLYMSAPLSRRGWCLQESILSPRTLYYGESHIYWKCGVGCQSADGACPGRRLPESESTYPLFASTILRANTNYPPDLDIDGLLAEYYSMLQQFSHRKLTFHRDKLPAISGLARRFHNVLGGSYLAGVWSCDIHGGILWSKEMLWAKHVERYRGPSWSWVVTDDRVLFNLSERNQRQDSLRLVDFGIQLESENNCYGGVVSAYITVVGFTIPLWRSLEIAHTPGSESEIQHRWSQVSWDEPLPGLESESEVSYSGNRGIFEESQPDNVRTRLVEKVEKNHFFNEELYFRKGLHEIPRKEYLALLVATFLDESNGEDFRGGGQCLVLDRDDKCQVYRRAGLLSLSPYPLSKFQSWTKLTLKLV